MAPLRETPSGLPALPALRDREQASAQADDASVYWDARPDGEYAQKVRLFDRVQGVWTAPFELFQAQYLLRLEVLKCSACAFASAHNGHVSKHQKQLKDNASTHEGAVLNPILGDKEGALLCTGCGMSFLPRKNQARKHLRAMQDKDNLVMHENATEIAMLKFGMEASVPTQPAGPAGTNGVSVGLESRPAVRSRRRRTRSRRRR